MVKVEYKCKLYGFEVAGSNLPTIGRGQWGPSRRGNKCADRPPPPLGAARAPTTLQGYSLKPSGGGSFKGPRRTTHKLRVSLLRRRIERSGEHP